MMKFHNLITFFSLISATIINFTTHDAKGWTGMGYMLIFGLYPLIAVLVLLIISLFILKISKWRKFFMVIGVAYSLLSLEIILGTTSDWMSFLFPSVAWLLPLLVCNFFLQWFNRTNHDRPAKK